MNQFKNKISISRKQKSVLTFVISLVAIVIHLVLHLHVIRLSVDAKVWLVLFIHVLGEDRLPNFFGSRENIFEGILLHFKNNKTSIYK